MNQKIEIIFETYNLYYNAWIYSRFVRQRADIMHLKKNSLFYYIFSYIVYFDMPNNCILPH